MHIIVIILYVIAAVIALSNCSSGIYMVELTSGNSKVVQRLMKE